MSFIDNFPQDIVYVMDNCPGLSRRKNGRGFIYFDCDGRKISDERTLQRIRELVIPPAWSNVWICQDEKGHLQVTGYDPKERKQYIYHPKWVEYRQKTKYSKLGEFGRRLPEIRKTLEEHIRLRGWPKKKMLALIVMMLDEYYIRIGNKFYEHENKTYGLTTLRRKHIVQKNGKLYLHYKAKSGKERRIKVESRRLIHLIRKISELPGYEIFKYQDKDGKFHHLHSHDVNEYLVEIAGQPFTAKDFRTWGGTVLALDHYEEARKEIEENPRRKLEAAIVKKVAGVLGNTVATCRAYYIHPDVMDVLLEGKLQRFEKRKLKGVSHPDELSENEKTVIKIVDAEN